MITAMPANAVAEDSSLLLVFSGAIGKMVIWGLSGPGSLHIFTDVTDANGVALAKYIPGAAGDTPTITVTYAS